ncbi:ABC transporter substrate-binding protein [Clostridium sp. Marseille-P2415]|uniref:ABC transporter substrate-binding protein n=1 Tax=Clostridium sp. Marseille-P2415 TaxID=1805471 RepID=UPI00098872CD|nr:extracellular solute-binding protein [Clostridium sp. Marseille-P2415]
MKRKMVAMWALAALALTTMTLAGCGKKEKEIEFFSSKSENAAILQSLVDAFNQAHTESGVTIVLNTPADPGTVLKTRLAKNDVPDIMALGGDNNYKEVQETGVLADLSKESYMDSIQESYLQMVYDVQKGKEAIPYAVPYAANASGVLYNVDKFNELNLKIPKTWDEFIEVIHKIEQAGEEPFVFTFKDAWTGLCPWNSMAPDLQPEGFAEDRRTGTTTFAATHQEIAEKYLELLKHAQNDFMGTTYDDGNKAFANGKGVMMINGNWAINQFTNANPDFHVDMFALPSSNDESKNYVTSGVDMLLCANKDSKNLAIAKEFLAFLLEQKNAKAYIDDQFAFSAVKGVEQKDARVAGVKEDIGKGKVANFPDHDYPSAFNLSALLSEYSLNHVNGMGDAENIAAFLADCDKKYDAANVE